MSDPFVGLNINNLQSMTASATRLPPMNHQMMSQPLMSPHSPQLPQQQHQLVRNAHHQRLDGQTSQAPTGEEDSDERKKFEKSYKFQLQQKRLQEMSFASSTSTPLNSHSSADQLMANIIQKVETEAKFDKRMSNSHVRGAPQMAYNQTMSPQVMANSPPQLSMISGANTSHAFVPQYPNARQLGSTHTMASQPSTVAPNDRHLPQQHMNHTNSYHHKQSPPQDMSHSHPSYTQNQSLKTTPILQHLFPDRPESDSHYYNTNLPSNQTSMTSANASTAHHKSVDSASVSVVTHSVTGGRRLPPCFDDLSKLPALYSRVWTHVRISDNLCDTNRLYAVLLSVGLPQQVLAQLWSVVNQTIPGQLTRPELFMALALIALLQKNSVNPLDEIYKLDSLPVPTIRFFDNANQSVVTSQQVQGSTEPQTQLTEQTVFSDRNQSQHKVQTNSVLSQNGSDFSPNFENNLKTSEETTNDDDFDDFKSADFKTNTVTDQKVTTVLAPKQTSDVVITGTVVNSISDDAFGDEFDDFKSATPSVAALKTQTPDADIKSKTHTLSEALMSNMSAISGTSSPQTVTPTPAFTISFVNSSDSGQNTLESSPDSIGVFESMPALHANSSTTSSADRYSVFRELTSAEPSKGDDFGNFLSHTTANFDAESVDSLSFGGNQDNGYDSNESISHQMIQTCRQLIHKAFNVLIVSHGEDSVLEAIRANNGVKFALDLLEVYAIVKRLDRSLKASDKLSDNLVKLIEDVDNTWNTISSLFTKASIDVQLRAESTTGEPIGGQTVCTICCSKATPDHPVIPFAGYDYHTSCANLWLNCINPSLPQPLINCR